MGFRIFILTLLFPLSGISQTPKDSSRFWSMHRMHLFAYGTMNYYHYDWQTYEDKRDEIDLERVVFSLLYDFTDKLSAEIEIEFEHGGTGATMEFDYLEEFGEFEQEIEKGGEVLLEELELEYQFTRHFAFEFGRLKVPVGFTSFHFLPGDYLTTTYNTVETTLLPVQWYENGIGAEGFFATNKLEYHAVLVNGLDNSGYSSANWIRNGYQVRFETVNAEDWAAAARLDFHPVTESAVGISAYYGNSTGNRPKPDLDVPGYVGLYDLHASWQTRDFSLNALVLYGTLSNADEISEANYNLSNNLNVKRTPVGSAAGGFFAEAGYNVFSLFHWPHTLQVFTGYYYYDSMLKTTGEIFDNPRWQRSEVRTGMAFNYDDVLLVKADFSHRWIGIPDNNIENTFSAGFGFQF